MKEILKISGLLAVFYFMAVATSIRKYSEIPCASQIQTFLMKDTINRGSCNISNFSILVVDTVLARDPARQTRYGNRIYYRKCN